LSDHRQTDRSVAGKNDFALPQSLDRSVRVE
jgi:hypothetical protein